MYWIIERRDRRGRSRYLRCRSIQRQTKQSRYSYCRQDAYRFTSEAEAKVTLDWLGYGAMYPVTEAKDMQ